MSLTTIVIIALIIAFIAIIENEDKFIYFLDQIKLLFMKEQITERPSMEMTDVDQDFESIDSSPCDIIEEQVGNISNEDLFNEDGTDFASIVDNEKAHPSVKTSSSYLRAFQVEVDSKRHTLLQYAEGFVIKVNGIYKALDSKSLDDATEEAFTLLKG